jgi:hypothetical protein
VLQSAEWISPELVHPPDNDVWWLSDNTGGLSTQRAHKCHSPPAEPSLRLDWLPALAREGEIVAA